MPRKIVEQSCHCGCGGMTKGGEFIPGHDSKLMRAILQETGGVLGLHRIIEQHTGKAIRAELD